MICIAACVCVALHVACQAHALLYTNFVPNIVRVLKLEGTDLSVPLADQYRCVRCAHPQRPWE